MQNLLKWAVAGKLIKLGIVRKVLSNLDINGTNKVLSFKHYLQARGAHTERRQDSHERSLLGLRHGHTVMPVKIPGNNASYISYITHKDSPQNLPSQVCLSSYDRADEAGYPLKWDTSWQTCSRV